eukprot:TRINITY_DN14473_c0_g1_i1.p1 TRINITY_DN14473_c0_g1~~TRINITY_DN14473_c0_g1_i1.p1  ORF type:complete len:1369 (+),score=473.79 TRINITY_DN14473_c0_g1_i1:500-4108(+)
MTKRHMHFRIISPFAWDVTDPQFVKIHEVKKAEPQSKKRDIWAEDFMQTSQGSDVCGLPAYKQRTEVLEAINDNKIVIIHGPTGSGKSTILPMAIRNQKIEKNVNVKIIVGQPRRLAAVTLRNRVCELEGSSPEVLSTTSYRIGMDNITTPETTLEYATYGSMRNLLMKSPRLEGYTHVFLDEIHERSLDMDTALAMLLPAVLDEKLKLIIMSATCNVDVLKEYLEDSDGRLNLKKSLKGSIGTVQLKPTTGFKVTKQYLENVVNTVSRKKEVVAQGDIDIVQKYMAAAEASQKKTGEYIAFQHGLLTWRADDVKWKEDYVKNWLREAVDLPVDLNNVAEVLKAAKVPGRDLHKEYLNDLDEYLMAVYNVIDEQAKCASKFVLRGTAAIYHFLEETGTMKQITAAAKEVGRECVRLEENTNPITFSSFARQIPKTLSYMLPNRYRFDLAFKLLKGILTNNEHKGILMFLPGFQQINEIKNKIQRNQELASKAEIFIMHSNVPLSEQKKSMGPAAAGKKKLILATNAAESSITLPAVDAVIDICLGRYEKDFNVIQTERSSQDAAEQRAGRTGRTSDGTAYRLVSRLEWVFMSQFRNPELYSKGLFDPMRKLLASNHISTADSDYSLDSILRRMANYSIKVVTHDPDQLINRAAATLLHQGAITEYTSDEKKDQWNEGNQQAEKLDYRLTRLGRYQASIPLSWHWAKFLYIGCRLGIHIECAYAAALCSRPALYYLLDSGKASHYFLKFGAGTFSDPIVAIEIMRYFRYLQQRDKIRRQGDNILLGPDKHKLSYRAMNEATESAAAILDNMLRFRLIRKAKEPDSYGPMPSDKRFLVLFCWAAAFSDNICIFSQSERGQSRKHNCVKLTADEKQRSVVVTIESSRKDADEEIQKFEAFVGGCESKRQLTDADWEHDKQPQLVTQLQDTVYSFYLMTFKPSEDKVWGVHHQVWLAEKCNQIGVSAMGCSVWRAHSDVDHWVPFGKCQIKDKYGFKVDHYGVSAPILNKSELLAIPAEMNEFRTEKDEGAWCMRDTVFLPYKGEDGVPLAHLLVALMSESKCRDTYAHEQLPLDIGAIPSETKTVTVDDILIDTQVDTHKWIRSEAFRKLRTVLHYTDEDTELEKETNPKEVVSWVDQLLDMIGYTQVRDKLLDTESSHEEFISELYPHAPLYRHSNPDYTAAPEEFAAQYDWSFIKQHIGIESP